ncbi:zinc-ribbon domain-containing protein, partial [Arthrobacter sp. H20]|uniref:zinc-ribbon domain-containing protein n=1 Tax=Arthrobacter sp. H20 TaxID=1267981 RepID=UPI001C1DD62D
MSDRLSGTVHPVSMEQVAAHLEAHEFEPVEELFDLPSGGWPVITRCKLCGVQSAERMGDVGWGCVCTRNSKPRSSLVGRTRGEKKLFVESGREALGWWDHNLNEPSVLATVAEQAKTQGHWKCPTCTHSFTSSVASMVALPRCPECTSRDSEDWGAERDRLKVTPVSDVPELLAAWNDEADPGTVMVLSHRTRKFQCQNGHKPKVTPTAYFQSGCQFCRRTEQPETQRATLAEAQPEVAGQWHPTLNGRWTPEKLGPDSKRTAHWLTDCCGHEWAEPVRNRNKYQRQRCPQCRTILDSLGYVDPGLAAEWDLENPTTPWHVRPHGQTSFLPRWICSVDSAHRWEASLTSRSGGSDCPECKQAGKSRVELQHLDAAKEVFAIVKSGAFVRSDAFETRKRWSVDILVEHDGHTIAVEYDGAYWHSPEAKVEVDRRKSLDLLAAGYRVVRLREDDLPSSVLDRPTISSCRSIRRLRGLRTLFPGSQHGGLPRAGMVGSADSRGPWTGSGTTLFLQAELQYPVSAGRSA